MTAACDCSAACQFDDRFQPATRELMVFTKSKDRYFDLDAVRGEVSEWTQGYANREVPASKRWHTEPDGTRRMIRNTTLNQQGAPPLDWWLIPYTDPPPTHRQGEPMTATFYVGDAVTVMNTLPEKSVDLILTSPPFLALRSYLPSDHPDKALEGGSQATPGAYVDWLLDVVEACARVLAPHGSLCFELGDTYSGSGGAGGDYGDDGLREGQSAFIGSARRGGSWPLAKSLTLIPETFRFAMVYGHNPHTGRRTPPWRLRNVIRWVRPNPPVGALGDKFRPATSELMVFCKAKDRFFDLDAVRGEFPEAPHGGHPNSVKREPVGLDSNSWKTRIHPAGAPPLDWWNIPHGGYPGAHYAVWPPELLVKPIKAMCPEKVCRRCGEPSRRIVGEAAYVLENGSTVARNTWTSGIAEGKGAHSDKPDRGHRFKSAPTLGFSDCGHNDWRPGLVLDPFAGSGTTLAVATGHGRDAWGIDLDEKNYELALDRVGPLILERGTEPARRINS